MTATQSIEDLSFMTIAELFVQSMRAGNQVSIAEFTVRYPHLADEIEEEFPALEMAEQLNSSFGGSRARRNNVMPKKISNYSLHREIGKGGMGHVYAAVDDTSHREVAIKVMSLVGPTRKNGIKRFRREAKAAGELCHPNIVPIIDHGEQDDIIYIVMPMVKGSDLSQVMDEYCLTGKNSHSQKQAMSYRKVAEIGFQVSSALAYAHEQGLIHRDIKPSNLLLEPRGHVWLTDFGLVKTGEIDQSLSRQGDLIGTPRYMAPEQLRGICDNRSDIYGLGITLYELVTGRKAWGKLHGHQLLSRPSSLTLPPISSVNAAVPSTLVEIITKCCALNPEDRYQTANELRFVLNRFLQDHRHGDRRKSRNSLRSIFNRRYIRVACATAIAIGFLGCAATSLRLATTFAANMYLTYLNGIPR